MENQGFIDAVKLAMEAEKRAAEFYHQASEHTSDPKGRDMFAQLERFELKHYENLETYLEGDFREYKGTEFEEFKTALSPQTYEGDGLTNDIDAISYAIEAEKKAKAAYRDLAALAAEERIVAFFNKLVYEEDLHRRLLEDQYFALSNKGYWTWGE